ncbi:MAG TPA: hypothetical protein VM345_02995 [Acidimicrobiales bacterium]|jgi:D-alanine-D-alanine ligase|nr:hypothetical protein [Acidimicrobiales bacterium]
MSPRPAVLFGGISPEHDVSIITGLLAAQALAGAGHDVEAIYWSKRGDFYAVDPGLNPDAFVQGVPAGATELQFHVGAGFTTKGGGFGRKARQLEADVVVNCCHGGPGEDGTLQGLLDLAGLRYTGPSVAGASLGMDKLAFAAVCTSAGLPHLPTVAVDPNDPGAAPFDGPYIVKPRFGGSSIGIETFASWDDVSAFVRMPNPNLRRGIVVEPFRDGAQDIEIAIRRHPELQLSALSKPEKGGAIFDYRNKYVPGEGMTSSNRETPAQLPANIASVARDAARAVAHLAVVRGLARLDFLLIGDELFVNEINTIPGSLTKHLWVDPQIPFPTLLGDMIAEAMAGPGAAYSTEGADGSILRSSASIASKLG